MSLDDPHAAFHALPPCSKLIVVGVVVIGLVLNPIFGLDDAVAFCPVDILTRGQLHRLVTSALYVEGIVASLACCVAAVRIIAPWEQSRGTLRTAFDGASAIFLTNVASLAFAILAGAFAPHIVWRANFLGDTGVLVAVYALFVREMTRAPATAELATPFGVAAPAKRVPVAAAVILIVFGWNFIEVFAALYVGTSWGLGQANTAWVVASDGFLANLENTTLAFASQSAGYVAVNGQTLPVTRDRESGGERAGASIVASAMEAVSTAAREMRRRFASGRRRSSDAEDAEDASVAEDAPATDAPATTIADARPKPVTREERAAAFAAAFEQRRHDREDDGSAA
jgi:hypothetical protein